MNFKPGNYRVYEGSAVPAYTPALYFDTEDALMIYVNKAIKELADSNVENAAFATITVEYVEQSFFDIEVAFKAVPRKD